MKKDGLVATLKEGLLKNTKTISFNDLDDKLINL